MVGQQRFGYSSRMKPRETSGSNAIFTLSPRPGNASLPAAVIFVNDTGTAGVCAWCEGKSDAETWCEARGLVTTHGVCPVCRDRLLRGDNFSFSQQVA